MKNRSEPTKEQGKSTGCKEKPVGVDVPANRGGPQKSKGKARDAKKNPPVWMSRRVEDLYESASV
jgi:hypothetical protein